MERKNDHESGLLYLMGGVAIGSVLGLLLAPKKGSETRDDLADWLRGGREKKETVMSRLGAMVPLKVKAAAALGAMKEGGAEALHEVAQKLNLDGTND
jgi:gas vesicle protein